MTACVSFPELQTGTSRGDADRVRAERTARPSAERTERRRPNIDVLQNARATESAEGESEPYIPTLAVATEEQIAALMPDRPVEATLPPQPLPQFIDTVFGQILRVPYYTGPGVAQRREFVTLRGPVSMSNRRFFATVQMALRQYGLAVQIEGNAVRIVEDQALINQAPLFVRARALPDTPEPSRPVIQFFELQALSVDDVMSMLQEAYPNRGAVTFNAREDINTLVISGNAREVAAAAAVVDALDRPRFSGGQIARVDPVYWAAEPLTQAVGDALRTEGYQVSNDTDERRTGLVFLPVPFTNQMLIFSNNPAAFDRALYWVEQLDKPSAIGDQEGVFVYNVRNANAVDLGQLLGATTPEAAAARMGQGADASSTRRSLPRPQGLPQANTETGSGGRITIDPSGNRIIFRGTASQFEQLRALMVELDTPVQQVLVELTIAEVTLTDETRFGVEWFLQQTIGSAAIGIDTRGGSTPENGGLGATYSRAFSRGSVQAALNAIAVNSNLNILSTPRLIARSGSEAQILVGTDIPIITSQRAADSQTGGSTDILQSIQYRQTGVILNIRPVVYGDGRIDIAIFQEVSTQAQNRTSSIDSPIILNRSVTTQLTLREGTTGVIGGMIQDNYGRSQTGVPLLKDLPMVGQAFRSDSVTGTKVELLILVTPYVIRNDEQMADTAANYARSINRLMGRRGPQTYTLTPWRRVFQPEVTHGPGERAPTAPLSAPLPAAPTPPPDVKPKDRPAVATDSSPSETQAPAPAKSDDTANDNAASVQTEEPGEPASLVDVAPPADN